MISSINNGTRLACFHVSRIHCSRLYTNLISSNSFLENTISGQEEKDAKPLPRINKHSVFWIAACVGLTYYVEFFQNLKDNDDIKR